MHPGYLVFRNHKSKSVNATFLASCFCRQRETESDSDRNREERETLGNVKKTQAGRHIKKSKERATQKETDRESARAMTE